MCLRNAHACIGKACLCTGKALVCKGNAGFPIGESLLYTEKYGSAYAKRGFASEKLFFLQRESSVLPRKSVLCIGNVGLSIGTASCYIGKA